MTHIILRHLSPVISRLVSHTHNGQPVLIPQPAIQTLIPSPLILQLCSGPCFSTIPVKLALLYRGELVVLFSVEEVQVIAEPFQLASVSKFSFDCILMDIIRKFFVSLGLKRELSGVSA